jgi:hypothetical protein
MKCYTEPRNWMDCLKRPRQWKMDMIFGTWNFKGLRRSLKTIAKRIKMYLRETGRIGFI